MAKPPKCSRQIYRSNKPLENNKDYFRVALTIPFLDHVSADLEYKLPWIELIQYRGLYIIPYVMLNGSSNWKKGFMLFANYHCEYFPYKDFPLFIDIDAELDLWYKIWDCAKFKTTCLILRLWHWEGLTSFWVLCLPQLVNVKNRSHLFEMLKPRIVAQW